MKRLLLGWAVILWAGVAQAQTLFRGEEWRLVVVDYLPFVTAAQALALAVRHD